MVIRDVSTGDSRQLTLDLQSVTVNGSTYYVSTEDLQRSGRRQGLGAIGGQRNSRRRRRISTLLGAIAGGGRGAAIGAIAGAANWSGVPGADPRQGGRVPAETVLNFRLDQPLQLTR